MVEHLLGGKRFGYQEIFYTHFITSDFTGAQEYYLQPLSTYLKLMPGLEGKELTTHIVESLANMDAAFSECPEHVAERERMREKVEKRNSSGETDEEVVHSVEDTDRVHLDQVEPRDLPDMTYSLPSKPSKLKTKRSGSSALGVKKRLKAVSDKSAHSSWTCLEPLSSPTYPPLKSIPLNKEKNDALMPNLGTDVVSGHSSNCWIPKFKKDDGTCVTEEEKLVGNREACLAVWQGLFHPADASAFQKAAPQEIMKAMNSRFIEFGQMAMAIETMLTQSGQNEKLLTITNENKDKQLEALKLELERERQRAIELEGRLRKIETEQDVLKVDFIKELAKTEKELTQTRQNEQLLTIMNVNKDEQLEALTTQNENLLQLVLRIMEEVNAPLKDNDGVGDTEDWKLIK